MEARKTRLIVRLSSLGDVVLSLAAVDPSWKTTYVVSKPYGALIRGHPHVASVVEFDRAGGLREWWRLSRELADRKFDQVLDLHRNLRSRILRLAFFVKGASSQFRTVSKQRFRFWAFLFLKEKLLPSLRPTRWVERYSEIGTGHAGTRPSLAHLVKSSDKRVAGRMGLMPSSRWPSKEFPLSLWRQVIQSWQGHEWVLFGLADDKGSRLLSAALRAENAVVIDGVGQWDLAQTAEKLASCERLVSIDTGLAHIAEAVGTPVDMFFGPTHPDMGFGPWRPESRVFGHALGCRPCGRDGRRCYRFWSKRACTKKTLLFV